MKPQKIALILAGAGIACLGVALGQSAKVEIAKPVRYTFMQVGVLGLDGNRDDEKFFVGRLPKEGEAVEMVYVGRDPDNDNLNFQLRVRQQP